MHYVAEHFLKLYRLSNALIELQLTKKLFGHYLLSIPYKNSIDTFESRYNGPASNGNLPITEATLESLQIFRCVHTFLYEGLSVRFARFDCSLFVTDCLQVYCSLFSGYLQ